MTVQEQTSPETTTEGAVEYEVSEGIATIWLNRPHVKNCFNWEQLTSSAPRSSAPRRMTMRGSW